MFHGAAAANLVFCRRQTFAVELTTYHDVDERRPWRANFPSVRALRPDMHLLTYHLPFPIVYPDIHVNLLQRADTDHFIKGLHSVHIPRHAVDNILEMIDLTLA